jgi:type IV pilus assembly protein PilY1
MIKLPRPALARHLFSIGRAARHGAVALALGPALGPALVAAQGLNLAQVPLFLGTAVRPNVLLVLDNSQSMDGTMSGMLIAGDNATTRGNIARSVLRSTITSYRNSFNWGLASFDLRGAGLYTTYGYYFGNSAGVRYTNDCVAGISASIGGRRCVANPQPGNGFGYLTYDWTGDDNHINDVLYAGDFGPQIYGVGTGGAGSTSYDVYFSRKSGSGHTAWGGSDFSSGGGNWSFTPTDAGYLPVSSTHPRMFWLRRAWGYYSDISGAGRINQAVAADSTSHYNTLMALLASETNNNATTELKNAAVFTPLAGTLDTARSYFANQVSGKPSPISQSCQKNFVLLATDGMPTGKTNGSMYSTAELANSFNPATGAWTFGLAANDVFSRVTALRSTPLGGQNYDVQTYVIGLGDSVANAGAVATLNRMAQVGGTAQAYLASDQAALDAAFRTIAVDILSRTSAGSSVTLNAGAWRTGSKVYQGRFSSADWSGQLLAYGLTSSGAPATAPDWDAGQLLASRHWSTSRQIITYKPSAALGSRGVPFRWPASPAAPGAGEIDSPLVDLLNRNAAGTLDGFGQQRLEYLRGNAAREARNCSACAAPVFRNRPTTVLGDIVNSAPVYVAGPTGDFRDSLEVARYSSYAQTRASQPPMVFVGANDGMLHAFNAGNGAEVFAYVPYAVRSRLSALTANPYSHLYSVDGSPAVGDVFVSSAWRTWLVAGMNAGARGLYALDITNAASTTEASANQVVRWEVGDSDADVGHVFSKPILVKTKDGRWRAIVGNGYNSPNGRAVLLLVDLETGALTKVDTGAGSPAAPNGLSAVTVVSSSDNGVADLVYAGDLQGNLWKFDLGATGAAGWKVAYGTPAAPLPLFAAGSGQPITARPDITRFAAGGYMVTFGTGRYVDVADNGTTGAQAIYGIRDNGAPVAAAALQAQSVINVLPGASGRNYRLTTHAVGLPGDALLAGDNAITLAAYNSTRGGWKLTLPTSGERVVTEATVRAGRVVLSTLIPSSAACAGGGDGWVMDLDVATGNRARALDTNDDGQITAADYLGGVNVSGVQVGAVPAAATIMRSQDPKLDDKLINTSAGTILKLREAGSTATSRRAAWEQLQ